MGLSASTTSRISFSEPRRRSTRSRILASRTSTWLATAKTGASLCLALSLSLTWMAYSTNSKSRLAREALWTLARSEMRYVPASKRGSPSTYLIFFSRNISSRRTVKQDRATFQRRNLLSSSLSVSLNWSKATEHTDLLTVMAAAINVSQLKTA